MKFNPTILPNYVNRTNETAEVPSIMVGIVISSNDPQQMGRLQLLIPSLSDNSSNTKSSANHYPWASYGSPFGGIDYKSTRGPNGETTNGAVAYGMWAIPKEGTRVLVCAVDNDPNQLYWIGCLYPNSTPHTMPHGRFSTEFEPGDYFGPHSSFDDEPIQPLFGNQTIAFSSNGKTSDASNYEWMSRGADYSVAAAVPNRVNDVDLDTQIDSDIPDDQDTSLKLNDGTTKTFRQGYSTSRLNPNKETTQTTKNLESSTLSFVTPGFHSFSMDDRDENGRIRLRTTTGHQIILDDTNERIYISTNQGRNYIEMDSNGQIYIYSNESVSIRAEGDLNLTAEKKVRITGNEGVHIESHDEIRIHAVNDIYVKGDGHFKAEFTKKLDLRSGEQMIITTTSSLDISSTNLDLDTSGQMSITSGMKIDSGLQVGSSIKAGGDITSSNQSLNALFNHTHSYKPGGDPPTETGTFGVGGAAVNVTPSPTPAYIFVNTAVDLSLWTNIIPAHEPWARTFTLDKDINLTHNPELEYDDININKKMSQVDSHDRGSTWRR